MFSAAELIEVLHARYRRRFPLHADRPFGGFPPTWRAWFLSISERHGAVTGAPAVDYITVFLARPLRAPLKACATLDRWRGFARLGRQQWESAPRDQRGVRRFAMVFTGISHIVLCLLLLWVGFVAIGDAPPEARDAGESVQVEYIGTGTSADTGGAPAPGETDAPYAAAASGTSAPSAASAVPAPSSSASAASVNSSDEPLQPVEAAAAQPLAVTETARTDIDFTLPAPVPRDLTLPQLQVTTADLTTEIVEVETFEPRGSVRVLERPTLTVPTPVLPTLRRQVTDVEVLQQDVQLREMTPIPSRTPQLRDPVLRVTPGEVQVRASPAPATSTAPAASASTPAPPATVPVSSSAAGRAPAASSAAASNAPAVGGRPQAQGTGRPTGLAPSGAGPGPSPRPGATASPTRSDDWGDSNRNVPGNSNAGRNPGLFNSDGSVRLPGDGGRAGGGLPPGTIIEDFEKIDRMGTWLKRPPLDYTPTRFDRFWIPNRSLLEEWVSRGIRKVAIPIPGTTKRIECTVSLLQAGGGCTIYDPNLQDQEAVARPPPDVPFKPELQEDKDSLKK